MFGQADAPAVVRLQVLGMPGVAGLHVMPLGKAARLLAEELLLGRESDVSSIGSEAVSR